MDFPLSEKKYFGSKIGPLGVPAVAQRDKEHLCHSQVQSPAPAPWVKVSGVAHSCHNCSLDLIPGPETPYAATQPKKKVP